MKIRTLIIFLFLLLQSYAFSEVIPKMINIKGGTFIMGSIGDAERMDEAPMHKVKVSSFRMSETEITNSQFEQYMPSHRRVRGKNNGISSLDDEAVVFVSYYDATGYCKWLSEKTGRHFRLPTEAEWEYACRAGSDSPFFFGDSLPNVFLKNQRTVRDFSRVSLVVGKTPPNAFGLYDMHGNVEEWCCDWFGAYSVENSKNPMGPKNGEFKVTRGGSHSTPVDFLRSTCRMAMIPEDSHSQTGFRIVESPLEYNDTSSDEEYTVSTESNFNWKVGDDAFFREPIPYVINPLYSHNHQPAICYCNNGDILVSWYSTGTENGRCMVDLCSRLCPGNNTWSQSEMFFRVPGRNITGMSLMNDNGVLRHINGVEASGDWQNLIMIQRLSYDNGHTWTRPQIIEEEHEKRHQVIAGLQRDSSGRLIQLCDAGPTGDAGSAIHQSLDNGRTWNDMWDGVEQKEFKEGERGSTIAGIHASVVELKDGSLLAMGRGNYINGKMPESISKDGGRTWTYGATEFPPISSGQRLVLMRLREGPLLLISFTGSEGMPIDSKIRYGLFAALSFDEGKSWPVRKLISDGKERQLNGGAWTQSFTMDETHAEPKGYMAAVESPDNIIHLVSSRIYYAFNLKWLLGDN